MKLLICFNRLSFKLFWQRALNPGKYKKNFSCNDCDMMEKLLFGRELKRGSDKCREAFKDLFKNRNDSSISDSAKVMFKKFLNCKSVPNESGSENFSSLKVCLFLIRSVPFYPICSILSNRSRFIQSDPFYPICPVFSDLPRLIRFAPFYPTCPV